jgi:hypothetical protein
MELELNFRIRVGVLDPSEIGHQTPRVRSYSTSACLFEEIFGQNTSTILPPRGRPIRTSYDLNSASVRHQVAVGISFRIVDDRADGGGVEVDVRCRFEFQRGSWRASLRRIWVDG